MKLGFNKFKSPSTKTRCRSSQKEHVNSLAINNTISVSQEYKAAIRTSSYEEMFSRIQIQLTRTSSDLLYSSASSSTKIRILHLSETLLEPGAETLDNIIKTLNLHHLLVDYFSVSSEACSACELLLRGIRRTRMNYGWIKRAVDLSRLMNNLETDTKYCDMIREEFETFVSLKNPLGFISSVQFHDMHEVHVGLLHRLVEKRNKISRRMRTARVRVRVIAMPGMLFSCLGLGLGFSDKTTEEKEALCHRRNGEKLSMELDAAAKWLFVLVNDMDTVSSLVEKLYCEVEHSRARADLGMKSTVMMREVVREFDAQSINFMEQLEELEEHIYLCLLTINKSRRSLLYETLTSTEQGGGYHHN